MIDDWRSTKTAPRDAMCVSHAGSLAEQGAEIIIFSRPDRHRINLPASPRISPHLPAGGPARNAATDAAIADHSAPDISRKVRDINVLEKIRQLLVRQIVKRL